MGRADQEIIPHRYTAIPRTLCFVTHDGDVLLLRGASDRPLWPSKYNGLGGHVEADETVQGAALREIREEAGLDVRDLRLRGVINIPVGDSDANTGIVLFVFTAAAATRQVRASEEGAPEWVSPDQLDRLDLVEDLTTLIPRVLAMAPDAPPFFAHYRYDERDRLVITFAASRE